MLSNIRALIVDDENLVAFPQTGQLGLDLARDRGQARRLVPRHDHDRDVRRGRGGRAGAVMSLGMHAKAIVGASRA